jgi:hypothetical protein
METCTLYTFTLLDLAKLESRFSRGNFMKYLVFICLLTSWTLAQDAKQVIEKSLQLLDKAPYYSVIVNTNDGLAQYDFIAPDQLRYHASIEDALGDKSEGFAIQIGADYWDKFMDGPWTHSSVDTDVLGDMDFFDEESSTENIKSLGVLSYADLDGTTKSCNQYSFDTTDETSSYSTVMCIDAPSGLPVRLDITDETGTLFIYYSYKKPADITPPITEEIE